MRPVLPGAPKHREPKFAEPFDYASVDAETAELAREIAEKIKRSHALSAIDAGRNLIAIKDRLGHGKFGGWLAAEFGWNERTAQRYMQAAAVFGDKTDIVTGLRQSIIYKLAAPSTPRPVRNEIVSRLASGERVPADEVHNLLSKAREIVKRKREEANPGLKQRKRQDDKKDDDQRQLDEDRTERKAKQEQQPRASQRVTDFIISRLDRDEVEELIILMSDAGGLPPHHEIANAMDLDMRSGADWQAAARQRLANAGNGTNNPSSTLPASAVKSSAARAETREHADSGEMPDIPTFLRRGQKPATDSAATISAPDAGRLMQGDAQNTAPTELPDRKRPKSGQLHSRRGAREN